MTYQFACSHPVGVRVIREPFITCASSGDAYISAESSRLPLYRESITVHLFSMQHGTTLLMVASYAGHIDCVRELVLQGADINLQREVSQVVYMNKNDQVKLSAVFMAVNCLRGQELALLCSHTKAHCRVYCA